MIYIAFAIVAIYYIFPNLIFRKKLMLKNKTMRLTFDDGPTKDVTDKVLDELKLANTSSIFFVLGEKAKNNKELINRIINEGHEIGLHGYKHVHGIKMSPWTRWNDLKKGIETLNSIGIKPKYYRPTHGFYTIVDVIFCYKYKLTSYHWWSLLKDWENPDPVELAERIYSKGKEGGVLVLHDGCEGSADPNAMIRMPEGLSLFFRKYKEQVNLFYVGDRDEKI